MLLIFQKIKTETATIFHAGDDLSPVTVEAGDLSVISMPMRIG
jgi:hypothetical protein